MKKIKKEYEAAFRRAFKDNEMDAVRVDGWDGEFLLNALKFGQRRGWLDVEFRDSKEGQYSCYVGTLTNEGRTYFG